MAGSLLMGCSKKGPECQMVIGSLNELGTKLAEAQKVTGNNDSKPEQVATALRPFAASSKLSGEKLAQSQITVAEIKKIAGDASGAALALSASATKMADMADHMKGLDAAGKALDDQKKVVDTAEAGVKKICEASPAQCAELVKVLEKFPPPPEKADNLQATGAWSSKLSGWAADLAKVKIDNSELKAQVSAYDQGWKTFAATMTTLVGITETAKKYDDVAKEFNAQIDVANKAVAAANGFCNAQ
jgi:hypothetical protein